MSFVGISGPLATGKSTLVSLIESSLPIDSVVIHDLHDKVYTDITELVDFSSFREVAKDRDFLLIYYGKLINYYLEMLEAYKDYPGLVLFDGTHVDLLIYGMLSLWYHYPSQGVQEKLIKDLLSVRDKMQVIYMTVPDDSQYKLDRLGERRYTTAFRKNRETEISYYDIFRELPYVVTLPSPTVLSCDKFILDDMKSRNLF